MGRKFKEEYAQAQTALQFDAVSALASNVGPYSASRKTTGAGSRN
jgi:hypothetical protein